MILSRVLVSRYGHFSGINRKVQLTYLPHGQPKTSSEEEGTAEQAGVLFFFFFVSVAPWPAADPSTTFQTHARKVRLCCWCWSGEASWPPLAECRPRSWAGPSAACIQEGKVTRTHMHTHAPTRTHTHTQKHVEWVCKTVPSFSLSVRACVLSSSLSSLPRWLRWLPRLRVAAAAQHLQTRPEDLRLRWRQSTDDGRRLRQGLLCAAVERHRAALLSPLCRCPVCWRWTLVVWEYLEETDTPKRFTVALPPQLQSALKKFSGHPPTDLYEECDYVYYLVIII